MRKTRQSTGAALAWAALLIATNGRPAVAETVYRCGNTYTGVPCPRATVVDVDDTRTPAQAAEARAVASREKALAAQMASDRVDSDVRPTHSTVRLDRAKPTPATSRMPVLKSNRHRRITQDNGQGDFVAFVPAPRRQSGTKK